jgi:hypothetical protein
MTKTNPLVDVSSCPCLLKCLLCKGFFLSAKKIGLLINWYLVLQHNAVDTRMTGGENA